MRVIKQIIFITLLIVSINNCIEPYYPQIDDKQQLIVINGLLTNQEGFHYVAVSRSASYSVKAVTPINDCEAKIIDNNGNIFEMENYSNGKYRTWIDQEYLKPGKYFKLEITLNNGEQYVSAYDTLLLCPDIDSIYYDSQEILPDDPIYNVKKGIQFYIDFDATGNYSRNYRWEFNETWEYHAAEPIRYYYDPEEAGIKDLMTYDYSLFKCWKSSKVKNIFTYSTFQMSDKKVTALPLNFVTNEDNRLTKKYSVLIQQFTLSDIAFKYWNHLQQSKATGGLYESQPYRIEGNIKNVNDANEAVIGLFCVSSVKSKRFTGIFYSSPNRDCNKSLFRNYEELLDYLHSDTSQLPIYLLKTYDLEEPFIYVDQQCFDCTKAGGDTIKPEYW